MIIGRDEISPGGSSLAIAVTICCGGGTVLSLTDAWVLCSFRKDL